MNISYIYYTNWHPSRSHGKQIIHTINGLERLQNTVTLYTPADVHEFLQQNGLETRANINSIDVINWNKFASRLAYYALSTFFSINKDIIFTRDIWYLKFLRLIPTSLYPPVLYEAHQCYSMQNYITPEDEYQRIQQADRVITQSYGVERDLSALGIDVAAVIPNAAPEYLVPETSKSSLRTQCGFSPDSIVVIYSGSFAHRKNDFKLLIDAMSALESSDTPFELAFVGGDEQEIDKLRSYCGRHLTNTRYHFFGRVPHRAVFRYLKASDIGIVPLKSDNLEAVKYTSPIKLFEYLACNLQVVASDVTSIEKLQSLSDSIHTYSAGSVESLSDTISDVAVINPAHEYDQYSYKTRAEKIKPHLSTLLE